VGRDGAGGEVEDEDLGAVDAGLADAGAAVDGEEGGAAVGGDGGLVGVDAGSVFGGWRRFAGWWRGR